MHRIKEWLFGGRYMNALVGALRGRRYRPFEGSGWQRRWLGFTIVVEIGHLSIALYMLASAAGHLARGEYRSAAISFAINTLVNIYPAMVQRYNRARLVRIFKLSPGH